MTISRKQVSLLVLYDNDNRVLLQHRTDDAEVLPGYWAFFGGGIMPGETYEDTVVREVREELNYVLKQHILVLKQDYDLPNEKGTMYLYAAPYKGNKTELELHEGQGMEWYHEADIADLKMMPHDRKAVCNIIEYVRELLMVREKAEKCLAENNQSGLKTLLDSVDSIVLKTQICRQVVSFYASEGIFPAGYVKMLILCSIKSGNLRIAQKYIAESIQNGVLTENLSAIVYEYLIKPEEDVYRVRVNENLNLLRKYGVLFTDLDLEFESIKQRILRIYPANADLPRSFYERRECRYFLLDFSHTRSIFGVLSELTQVYLKFNDMQGLYYLLMFADLSLFIEYIKKGRLLIFAETGSSIFQSFINNVLILPPEEFFEPSSAGENKKIVNDIMLFRLSKAQEHVRKIEQHYGKLNHDYYRNLFSGPTEAVKILLVTSESTDLNKHIVMNWYKAFQSIGYNAKICIEKKPYEMMNVSYIMKEISEFLPDIVFHVNYSISHFFDESNITKNMMWIMRYRDMCGMDFKGCDNMFISSMVKEWTDDLKDMGMDPERTMYISDGVDCNVFAPSPRLAIRKECDIVSVNNSGGDEFFRLTILLNMFESPIISGIAHELYAEVIEMSGREEFIFFDRSFEKMLAIKLAERGIDLNLESKSNIIRFLTLTVFSVYRRKVVEWIADSGITRNIQVWGRGWGNFEKFKRYHMGLAKYGEQLSGIYGSSSISISDHPNIPVHERNFEILASGGFPLVKYVEPENNENIDYITNHFRENEEIVLFYNKEDLLNKVQYYLDNPGERDRIAENGRAVVLEKFTNIAVADATIGFIKQYYQSLDKLMLRSN